MIQDGINRRVMTAGEIFPFKISRTIRNPEFNKIGNRKNISCKRLLNKITEKGYKFYAPGIGLIKDGSVKLVKYGLLKK